MNFNRHSDLKGQHAFLSASKYHWLNYDNEKLANTFLKHLAIMRGTKYHELAAQLINLGEKLPRTNRTFNMYVNDAIGFKMKPEQILFYSENCFGTADAISFRNNTLRIHDLKTGETPAHMEQLMIYAALFCLEYQMKASDITIELRIYQANDILVCVPTAEDVAQVIDKIVTFDNVINKIKLQEG